MRATLLSAFGEPEVLRPAQVPAPVPRGDQMLVRVRACGVCGHDLLSRKGHFREVRPPCVLGHEIAGEVVTTGELVSGFAAGDRVALTQRVSCGTCAACRLGRENLCRGGPGFYGESLSGGYGEFVVASARNAVRLPDAIPWEIGAILSCAVGTGFHALERAGVVAGDTVVVTAASGGVGLHTVEIAKLLGLTVIGTTTSEGRAAAVKQAGADHVIVSADGRFDREVRDLTGGAGASAVIEIAGSPTFESSMRCLAPGGRLVAVGNVRPGTVPLNPAVCILKEVEVVGSGHATISDLARVVRLVEKGRLHALVAATVPAADAARAHAMLESGAASGRLVLVHPHH